MPDEQCGDRSPDEHHRASDNEVGGALPQQVHPDTTTSEDPPWVTYRDVDCLAVVVDELYSAPPGALPAHWDVTEAVERPLTRAELAVVAAVLLDWANRDTQPDESYPERIAYLAWWIIERSPWSLRCSYPIAWMAIRRGMLEHGFTRNRDRSGSLAGQFTEELFIHCPNPEELAAHLREAYNRPPRPHA